MADDEKTPTEQIREYISLYLASYNRNYNGDEFEIKFGTNTYNQITKIDFDNIIQKLKSLNFHCLNDSGDYTLNIICLLYTSPSPRDLSTSRMPSSA